MRKKQQQWQTNFCDFAPFYSQIQEAYKTYMRTIGILLGGNSSTVKDRMNEIYDLEKKLAKVGFNWVWKDGVVVLVPQSRFVLMRIPYPELLSSLSRISFSFPVNSAFRVADKECIPFTFLESRTVFWSNPEFQEYPVSCLVLMSKLVTKAKHL